MEVIRTNQIIAGKIGRIGELCHISKNLYNEANYIIRQNFFENGKYFKLLPAQVSQETIKLPDKNWHVFFKANE